jgi:20S proteasome subunit beta 3
MASFGFFVQAPEELFEIISQALMNAQDRDALSGWGGIVHIMFVSQERKQKRINRLMVNGFFNSEKDKITTRTLKCRMD